MTDLTRAIAETFNRFVGADGYELVAFEDGCKGVDVGPSPAVDPSMGHGIYAVLDANHAPEQMRIAPVAMVDGRSVINTRGAFVWYRDELRAA